MGKVRVTYLPKNVLEAAKDRLRFIFSEFDNVYLAHSGGKDSTVIFNLALAVAKEMGRDKLPVLCVDQEAEFTQTTDLIRSIMHREDVEPHWLQVPIKMFNSTSHTKDWLNAWGEGEDWLREKDPIAIKENVFGTDRFKEMFDAYLGHLHPDEPCALIGGVRAEESPVRRTGLTRQATYKWVTWGKKLKTKDHYTFYPIYDWSYTDVWAAIERHGWRYNEIYDFQYRYGIPVHEMRVSNLHHETAVRHLFYLQEADHDLYVRLCARLEGVDAATKFNEDFFIKELPAAFADWREYRDYLLENLVQSEEARAGFAKHFASHERIPWSKEPDIERKMLKVHVNAILANDWTGTKLANFRASITGPRFKKKYGEKYGL